MATNPDTPTLPPEIERQIVRLQDLAYKATLLAGLDSDPSLQNAHRNFGQAFSGAARQLAAAFAAGQQQERNRYRALEKAVRRVREAMRYDSATRTYMVSEVAWFDTPHTSKTPPEELKDTIKNGDPDAQS